MSKEVDMTAINDVFIARPVTVGIIIQRKQGKVYTNVPHTCVSHSPTGYEFGFEGSGPADLALNILEAVLKSKKHHGARMACYAGTCFTLAFRLHQDFKRAHVALLDQDTGGTISYAAVVAFIERHIGDDGLDHHKEKAEREILDDDEYQDNVADPIRDDIQSRRIGG